MRSFFPKREKFKHKNPRKLFRVFDALALVFVLRVSSLARASKYISPMKMQTPKKMRTVTLPVRLLFCLLLFPVLRRVSLRWREEVTQYTYGAFCFSSCARIFHLFSLRPFFLRFQKKKQKEKEKFRVAQKQHVLFLVIKAQQKHAHKNRQPAESLRERNWRRTLFSFASFSFSEGVFYTLFCAKEERDLIENISPTEREFEILNIRAREILFVVCCWREKEQTCRTRKKRPRRKLSEWSWWTFAERKRPRKICWRF